MYLAVEYRYTRERMYHKKTADNPYANSSRTLTVVLINQCTEVIMPRIILTQ